MFNKFRLFYIVFCLAMLHSAAILFGMSTRQKDFLTLLGRLRPANIAQAIIDDPWVVDVTKTIINPSLILEIKKSWQELKKAESFQCLKENKFDTQGLPSDKQFKYKVFLHLHTDRWEDALEENRNIVGELFKELKDGNSLDGLDKTRELLIEICNDLQKLYRQDRCGIDINQADCDTLTAKWDQVNFDTSEAVRDIFEEIRLCCKQEWSLGGNKKIAEPLIKKLSLEIKCVDPKNRMFIYLEQLKKADDEGVSISASEIATVKKLWYRVGSFSGVSSISNMDPNFIANIKCFCDPDRWEHCNKNKVRELGEFLNQDKSIQALKILEQRKALFIEKLEALNKNAEISEEVHKDFVAIWKIIKTAAQVDDLWGMDEDFLAALQTHIFLQEWHSKSRLTLAGVFESPFFYQSVLDLYTEKKKFTMRSLIDPYYYTGEAAPEKFIEMLQKRLATLKVSALSLNVRQELYTLCEQVLAHKKFYNYSLVDRIVYPFHTSVHQIVQDLKIYSDSEINSHFSEEQRTELLESKFISEGIIAQFKTELLKRPRKKYDDQANEDEEFFKRNIGQKALGFLRRNFPGLSHIPQLERKLSMDTMKVQQLERNIKYFDRQFALDKVASKINIEHIKCTLKKS